MGFMAWNKPYGHTALAVNKHVYTTNHRAVHEKSLQTFLYKNIFRIIRL